ncbi:class I SAM-dependent rRNA methyltransferase [Sulfuriflexus mobilis]|uniref:class I SAM-dependent rRNA methyltransferase n=1 Tax=Sulfuriflexus mobilis TaxID=1811807 RepID=UPI000F8446F7|nr:class I SAM-dependent rRNA methyltransferase [Sulfuriflexus mobilis]
MNEYSDVLQLKKNEDRRLRAGHLWVYSNEVDTKVTPLVDLAPGSLVTLLAHNGKPLGTAYVNPHSLICARLISNQIGQLLDRDYFVQRLQRALRLRERFYPKPYYRLVFAEADGLPGLVIDRYAGVCVVQVTTAGMEQVREVLLEALLEVVRPTAVLWRNDSSARQQEGLETYVEPALGEVPKYVEVEEGGLRFRVSLLEGQKTGWFYDQRDNRLRLREYVRGANVLDVFAYLGGWGIGAAAAGADAVTCIDASAPACAGIRANAELNGLSDKVTVLQGDAFEVMKSLRGQHFEVINVDPPAFIKRRKDVKAGQQAYRRINEQAMQLLGDDGILVTSSCSHHLHEDAYLRLLAQAASNTGHQYQILEQRYQGPDHPVHPAIAETRYLKTFILRVFRP